MKTYKIINIQDSINLSHNIAKAIKAGDIITFTGTLGIGKTFFCQEIIRYLCHEDLTVPSPTFNLLNTYNSPKLGQIYHFDLYRLKSQVEIYELGIEEAWSSKSICLIEWPEIIQKLIPKPYTQVNLTTYNTNQRLCSITTVT